VSRAELPRAASLLFSSLGLGDNSSLIRSQLTPLSLYYFLKINLYPPKDKQKKKKILYSSKCVIG
jgi:hypothetical protein